MDGRAHPTRRGLMLGAVGAAIWPFPGAAQQGPVHTKPIPSTGEAMPVVGLGTWITFNVGRDVEARYSCTQVMRTFLAAGGRLIDSSRMYGSSQEVIGYGLAKLGRPANVFSADKVWISSGASGPRQIEASRRNWGIPRFDLLQVHNLLSWEAHLEMLFKEGGNPGQAVLVEDGYEHGSRPKPSVPNRRGSSIRARGSRKEQARHASGRSRDQSSSTRRL